MLLDTEIDFIKLHNIGNDFPIKRKIKSKFA